MDWNFKTNSWGLTGFEQQTVSNIDCGGTDDVSGSNGRRKFSFDLKLGHVANYNFDKALSKCAAVTKMDNSSSGSSKRARAGTNGAAQVAACLVDGCTSDLSTCRDYHRRHKVCEIHSKTPQVTINGHKQRFCQQCSRFHSLEEFDEGKRSCRKRLDGHNRRRRKPQQNLLSRSANFMSNYQGSQLPPFSNSHVYSSTSVGSPNWVSGVMNSDAGNRVYDQLEHLPSPATHSLFHDYSSSNSGTGSYKASKQFPFLQSTSHEASSVCQPLLGAVALSASNSGSGSGHINAIFDRFSSRVSDSDCALSLLSSSSPSSQTCNIGLSHDMVQPFSISKLSYGSTDSVLLPNNSRDESGLHCQGMFHAGSHNGSEAPQALPFNWD